MRRVGLVGLALWASALPALAQAPSYDAFSDQDGNIVTEQHGRGLIALLRDSARLEAVYADAGRELAERVSRPPCLAPVVRELSGWCVPDWSFIDFLSKDKPGGARLRSAFFHGFEERARQRRLENQLVLSAMNAILGAGVAVAAIREGGVAAGAVRMPEAAGAARVAGSRLAGAERAVIDPRKLTEYALNPTHPVGGNKARVFEHLGFNQGNAEALLKQLRAGVLENAAVPGKVDAFGARFTVDIPVVGPRGHGVVRTGWIIKTGSDFPELTTLFVK